MPPPNTRELTLIDIARAMVACRTNARELMEEATILLEAGRQTRAYTLFHAACEELAKFFILELAGKRLARGNPPNWRRLWHRVRNHDAKIAQAELRLVYDAALEMGAEAASTAEDIKSLFAFGLVPRNASLYTEQGPDGTFRRPSEIDWSIPLKPLHAAASALLRKAEVLGSSVPAIEAALCAPATGAERDAALDVLLSALEHLRTSGVSKEEAARLLENILKGSCRS